jgi:hypothetical protein
MGQSGADFGAVSTDGLVQRVRRKIVTAIAAADRIPFRGMRERRKLSLIRAGQQMEAQYVLVQTGAFPESQFREALIAVLDPRLSGGDRGIRFRW